MVKDILPKVSTEPILFVTDNFAIKMVGNGAGTRNVRSGKEFTSFISNEDMDNIIRMVKSLEN